MGHQLSRLSGSSMTMKPRLSAEESEVLSQVIWRRKPSLMSLVRSVGKEPLSRDQREELRGVLLDEFTETGLREDYEPNEWGLKIDDLIGRLMDF